MADGGPGISSSRLSNKKNFEYKMSKKVAELTQVVHMLFSRNHEREVELEATKDAYEHEITNVISDAKQRIEALEQRLAEERRKVEATVISLENSYERKLHEQKKEADTRLAESRALSDRYVSEINNLKSEISHLEKEVECTKQEALRTHFSSSRKPTSPLLEHQLQTQSGNVRDTDSPPSNVNSAITNSNGSESVASRIPSAVAVGSDCSPNLTQLKEDMRVKDTEIENLKCLVAMHVQTQRDNDVALGQFRKDFDRTESELRLRVAQLIDDATRANKAKDKLQLRNKTLEADLKNLKRSVERRKEAAEKEANKQRISAATSKSSDTEISSVAREEIERLRKEIKWYRMELSNREGNFNRMFADSNPIRLGSMAAGPSLGMARQRAEVGVIPNVGVHSSRSDEGSLNARSPPNRLPTLGMDSKQKDRDTARSRLRHNSGVGGGARRSSLAQDKHAPKSITSGYM